LQTPAQMQVEIDQRLAAMRAIADRLYARWCEGLKA